MPKNSQAKNIQRYRSEMIAQYAKDNAPLLLKAIEETRTQLQEFAQQLKKSDNLEPIHVFLEHDPNNINDKILQLCIIDHFNQNSAFKLAVQRKGQPQDENRSNAQRQVFSLAEMPLDKNAPHASLMQRLYYLENNIPVQELDAKQKAMPKIKALWEKVKFLREGKRFRERLNEVVFNKNARLIDTDDPKTALSLVEVLKKEIGRSEEHLKSDINAQKTLGIKTRNMYMFLFGGNDSSFVEENLEAAKKNNQQLVIVKTPGERHGLRGMSQHKLGKEQTLPGLHISNGDNVFGSSAAIEFARFNIKQGQHENCEYIKIITPETKPEYGNDKAKISTQKEEVNYITKLFNELRSCDGLSPELEQTLARLESYNMDTDTAQNVIKTAKTSKKHVPDVSRKVVIKALREPEPETRVSEPGFKAAAL